MKDLSSPIIHEIDTRNNSTLTVFDGSRDDESKLAKQFWNSVVLMPPVESTLVCKEIKQTTRRRSFNETKNKRIFEYVNFNDLLIDLHSFQKDSLPL